MIELIAFPFAIAAVIGLASFAWYVKTEWWDA